jgi:hypothetical protein
VDAVNELIMTAAMVSSHPLVMATREMIYWSVLLQDITSAEWAVVLFLDTVKQRLLYRPAGLKKTDKSLEARPA